MKIENNLFCFEVNKFWEPRTLVFESAYPQPGMIVYFGVHQEAANLENACGVIECIDGDSIHVRFLETPKGRLVREHAELFGKKSLYMTIVGTADEELFFPKNICIIPIHN